MTSSLPARGGRSGGARATEGRRATEVSERQATQAADRAARREERTTTAARQGTRSRATGGNAGPMGREVEQAPGAGPRIAASELGGRSVASHPPAPGDGQASDGSRSDAETRAGRGRSERTRRALRSPAALRQAIVIRELLGPPAAFQTGHRDVPGLPGH